MTPNVAWPAFAVLALLALAIWAEVRPVHFRREGVLLVFSLPFVVGILVLAGPLAAVVAECCVTFAGSLWQMRASKSRRPWFWARLNIPISLTSSSVAALAYVALLPFGWMAAVLAYVSIHLAINGLLVSRLNSLLGAKSFLMELRRGLLAAGIGVVVYGVVAVCVALLCLRGWVPAVALALIPLELLRYIVTTQNANDDMAHETMVALTIMLQRAHPYTHGHLERVGRIAEEVGLRLGIPRRRARRLSEAAVLHDIGKIAIDEAILDKPARLTEEEFEHVKQHSEYGSRILLDSPRFQELAPWILYHHERPDGRGYPHQLSDIEIPIESKIIAVSDAFDAMAGGSELNEKRSYRPNLTPQAAMEELDRCAGTQFDPKVVEAFRGVLRDQGVLSS